MEYEHFLGHQLIENFKECLNVNINGDEETKMMDLIDKIFNSSTTKNEDGIEFLNFKELSQFRSKFIYEKPTKIDAFGGFEKKKFKEFWIRVEMKPTKFLILMLEKLFTKYGLMQKTIQTISILNDDFSTFYIQPNMIYNFIEKNYTCEIIKRFNNKKMAEFKSAFKSIVNKAYDEDEGKKLKDDYYLFPDAIIQNKEDEESVSVSFQLIQMIKKQKANLMALNFSEQTTAYKFVEAVLKNPSLY